MARRILDQDEVNDRLIREARAGKHVVRLKGGDPAVFARGAEEAETLAQAGVPFEIVPGVTAALAAGSYAGIPVTHRDFASAVALVTGHERDGKAAAALDFRALANFPGTLVFYMGVTTARRWTQELIAGGKPGDTPAAIVRRCSWPDQQTISGTLDRVADELERTQLRPPAIVIVGQVVNLATKLSWFESRPLFGTCVLVTRPAHQAEALCEPLEELGAETLVQPAIEITPPDNWAPVDAELARLDAYDWLVFSSANGVRFLLRRLMETDRDLRDLGGLRIAAIGPATTAELAAWRLRADLQPEEFRAEALADTLTRGANGGQRFLLVRASRGREVLAEQLTAAGKFVQQIVVYNSTDVVTPLPEVSRALSAGRIDWVTVTSSAIARSLVHLFGEQLRATKLASISPITSDTLRQLGFEPTAEATVYTMPGLVEAIVSRQSAKA